ncbi:MAG: methylated-DNA-[protein]-cysteine S-methyltransferase [Chloroflexota bacterium]|jgi:methylated-DNA-[protein]-cysteine S-methyltransferase|nr:methylated-DNA-[protein]-cysteine S-methyltransferase [Chloroflexota bacterium]
MNEADLRAVRLPAAPDNVLDRLVERASKEGLVDISYGEMDSPLGPLLLAVTDVGLVKLSYTDYDPDPLGDLAARISPRIVRRAARTDAVRRELDEYFTGERREFTVPLDWTLVRGYGVDVLRATVAIPYGHVSTYRNVAIEAGNPRAIRAAGTALGRNPIPVIIPCHRVLRTGGGLGGYTSGIERKQLLLDLEGANR